MAVGARLWSWIAAFSLAANAAVGATWAWRHIFAGGSARIASPAREARVALLHELAAPSRDVVLLGDSLTERGEWWELLERPAANRGIGGDTVEKVRARLDDVVALEPRVVFLLVGVNDLVAGTDPDTLARRHDALVGELRRRLPRARVVVQSLLPIREELVAPRERLASATVRRANALLAPAAVAAGAEWLDLARQLADADGELDVRYSLDGLHLSPAGYRAWAAALRPYLP
jgi:lysophospholipase L1-like esterase